MSTSAPSGSGREDGESVLRRGSTPGATSQMAWKEHRRELVHYDDNSQAFLQPERVHNTSISLFSVTLGLAVRAVVPAHTFTWKDTTAQQHAAILSTMHTRYGIRKWNEITNAEGAEGEGIHVIEKAILRDAAKRLRETKSKFSKHYSIKCHKDPEYAYSHPPSNCDDTDKWRAAIEMFESQEFQVKFV